MTGCGTTTCAVVLSGRMNVVERRGLSGTTPKLCGKSYKMPLVKQGQTSGHKDKGQNGADEHAVSLLNTDRRSISLRDAK